MIISRIFGGLGNQLFQYAAALALAKRHETTLKLDASGFPDYALREFDLSKLNLSLSYASPEEIEKRKANNRLQRLTQRLLPPSLKSFYKEPFFHFDPSFFSLGKDVYLQGYFQSEKYFRIIEPEIRDSFDFSHLISEDCRRYAHDLQCEESIAVHIRRGDYQNADVLNFHGILPVSYYETALSLLRKKLPNARFYLFSDNPAAAAKDLKGLNLIASSATVSQNHFDDLYLMSQCRHNIIANSSFSWWGAWLNNNPDKIVVAPKNWFNQGPKDTQDLIPESWTVL